MLRLVFICIIAFPAILWLLWKTKVVEKNDSAYDEYQRYRIALFVVNTIKRCGFIKTKAYGMENLPADGGYIMYSNHQGKYDALGIMGAHKEPCTVVMDEKRSRMIVADQFISILKGCRLNKDNMKAQMEGLIKVISEVKAGRRYIIFPEGGYDKNHNNVNEFLAGSFKCAMKAKCPIVPVAIIDSYIPFEFNSLKPVTTQVHFLKPMYFEEYRDMNSQQIAERVRTMIVEKIESIIK